MGAGIAHALLLAGSRVVLVDPLAPDEARDRVAHALRASADRGALPDLQATLARLETDTGLQQLRGAGLVVEAVPEELELKARVLQQVEQSVDDACIIATNTSSLPVSRLAERLDRPGRFLGLHFFNPVPASLLVEVVRGQQSSPELVQRAARWVRALGKTPVVVDDSPGFASSRLGVALGLEAVRMLEEGVASAEDVDAAMTLGYKHPVGPLRLTDLVGLDVRLGIARHLERELGTRFSPPRLLVEKVGRGELGRKSGRGFYDWPAQAGVTA